MLSVVQAVMLYFKDAGEVRQSDGLTKKEDAEWRYLWLTRLDPTLLGSSAGEFIHRSGIPTCRMPEPAKRFECGMSVM